MKDGSCAEWVCVRGVKDGCGRMGVAGWVVCILCLSCCLT